MEVGVTFRVQVAGVAEVVKGLDWVEGSDNVKVAELSLPVGENGAVGLVDAELLKPLMILRRSWGAEDEDFDIGPGSAGEKSLEGGGLLMVLMDGIGAFNLLECVDFSGGNLAVMVHKESACFAVAGGHAKIIFGRAGPAAAAGDIAEDLRSSFAIYD